MRFFLASAGLVTDCASCQSGYGTGIGNTCHSCDDTRSRWLLFAGSLFMLVTLLILGLAAVFLIGGLDAVEGVRRTVSRSLSVSTKFPLGGRSASVASRGGTEGAVTGIAASFAPAFEEGKGEHKGEHNAFHGKQQRQTAAVDGFDDGGSLGASKSPDTVVGGGNSGRFSGDLLPSATTASDARRHATLAPSGSGGVQEQKCDRPSEGWREEEEKSAACCGIGDKIKLWFSRLPMDKLKILVVVWQILTVFPSITGAEFPPAYGQFLSLIDFINLDIGSIFSGTCVLPRVSFYQRLLVTTVTPIALAGVLALTYTMAKRRAGIGSASVVARKAAWSRHMAAGLLLTFLVRFFFFFRRWKSFQLLFQYCVGDAMASRWFAGVPWALRL